MVLPMEHCQGFLQCQLEVHCGWTYRGQWNEGIFLVNMNTWWESTRRERGNPVLMQLGTVAHELESVTPPKHGSTSALENFVQVRSVAE